MIAKFNDINEGKFNQNGYDIICFLPKNEEEAEKAQLIAFKYGYAWFNNVKEIKFKTTMKEIDLNVERRTISWCDEVLSDESREKVFSKNNIVVSNLELLEDNLKTSGRTFKNYMHSDRKSVYEAIDEYDYEWILFKVNTPDEAERAEMFAFENGYEWNSGSLQVNYTDSATYLVFDTDDKILTCKLSKLDDFYGAFSYRQHIVIDDINLLKQKLLKHPKSYNKVYKDNNLVYEDVEYKSDYIYYMVESPEKCIEAQEIAFEQGFTWGGKKEIKYVNAKGLEFNVADKYIAYSTNTYQKDDLIKSYERIHTICNIFDEIDEFKDFMINGYPKFNDLYIKPNSELVYESVDYKYDYIYYIVESYEKCGEAQEIAFEQGFSWYDGSTISFQSSATGLEFVTETKTIRYSSMIQNKEELLSDYKADGDTCIIFDDINKLKTYMMYGDEKFNGLYIKPNSELVYEGVNEDVYVYVYNTKNKDDSTNVYNLLFDNGYFWIGGHDTDFDEWELEATYILFYPTTKEVSFSTETKVEDDDVYGNILRYMRFVTQINYRIVNSIEEIKSIVLPVTMKTYTDNPKLVYEGLDKNIRFIEYKLPESNSEKQNVLDMLLGVGYIKRENETNEIVTNNIEDATYFHLFTGNVRGDLKVVVFLQYTGTMRDFLDNHLPGQQDRSIEITKLSELRSALDIPVTIQHYFDKTPLVYEKKNKKIVRMISYNFGEGDDVESIYEFLYNNNYNWDSYNNITPPNAFNCEAVVLTPILNLIQYAPSMEDLSSYIGRKEYDEDEYIIFYDLIEFKNYIKKSDVKDLYVKDTNKLVYEGLVDKKDAQIYIFQLDDDDDIRKVIDFIFKHGYTWPDNDTDTTENDYHAKTIFFNVYKKEITYSSQAERNLGVYIEEWLNDKSYYVFKNYKDLKSTLNPLSINKYFKQSNLVYEGLVTKDEAEIYIYNVDNNDCDVRKVYEFIFNNGYTFPGDNTRIDDYDYNIRHIFFNISKKEIKYCSSFQYDLDQHIMSHFNDKPYYVFKNFSDLKTTLKPMNINKYLKPSNLVYESLIDGKKIIDYKLPIDLNERKKVLDYLLSKGFVKGGSTIESDLITQHLNRTTFIHIFLETKHFIFLKIDSFENLIPQMHNYNPDEMIEINNLYDLKKCFGDGVDIDSYLTKKTMVYEGKIKKLNEL